MGNRRRRVRAGHEDARAAAPVLRIERERAANPGSPDVGIARRRLLTPTLLTSAPERPASESALAVVRIAAVASATLARKRTCGGKSGRAQAWQPQVNVTSDQRNKPECSRYALVKDGRTFMTDGIGFPTNSIAFSTNNTAFSTDLSGMSSQLSASLSFPGAFSVATNTTP